MDTSQNTEDTQASERECLACLIVMVVTDQEAINAKRGAASSTDAGGSSPATGIGPDVCNDENMEAIQTAQARQG